MKKIVIETIPHDRQRYDTIGDYFLDENGVMQVRVSKTQDRYEFLIAIHELIEAFLAKDRGILWESIDDFDKEFIGNGEPGHSKKAPYHKEHVFAEIIERMIAFELGIEWDDYCKEVDNL